MRDVMPIYDKQFHMLQDESRQATDLPCCTWPGTVSASSVVSSSKKIQHALLVHPNRLTAVDHRLYTLLLNKYRHRKSGFKMTRKVP